MFLAATARDRPGSTDTKAIVLAFVFWAFAPLMGLVGALDARLGRIYAADAAAARGAGVGVASVVGYFFIVLPMLTSLTVPERDLKRALGSDALSGILLMIPAAPAAALLGALAGWTLFKDRGAGGAQAPARLTRAARPLSDSEAVITLARRAAGAFLVTRLLMTPFLGVIPGLAVIVPMIAGLAALSRLFDGGRKISPRLRILGGLAGLMPAALVLIGSISLVPRVWWLSRGNWALVLLLLLYEIGGALLTAWPPRSAGRAILALLALPSCIMIGASVSLARTMHWVPTPAPTARPVVTWRPPLLAVGQHRMSWVRGELFVDAVLKFKNQEALSRAKGFTAHYVEFGPDPPGGASSDVTMRVEGTFAWIGPSPTPQQMSARVRSTFPIPRDPTISRFRRAVVFTMTGPSDWSRDGVNEAPIPFPLQR